MSAPKYDRSLLGDAIYWDGASEAICAALQAGDLMEVGRLVKHYADLSHADEVAFDAERVELGLTPRLAVVPVVSMCAVHPIFEQVLGDLRRTFAVPEAKS
jgi:hypothetical protein